MTFRTFENGIRIAKGYTSDPVSGKIGELYWNTVRNVLRQCVEDITPIWEDVTVKAGTTQFSTIYWDIVGDRWTENVLLLIDGRTVYAATSATPLDLTVKSGDTTDPGVYGSNLALDAGIGDAGFGDVVIGTDLMRQKDDISTAFAIKAGDSTLNAAGANLNLFAGTGTSIQGDINQTAENINFASGDKIRLGGEVVFTQILVSDPLTPETAQVYYHGTYKRLRIFDGVSWHWIDVNGKNIPIVGIDLFDDSILVLPPDTTTPVDGLTVTDGMYVIMQNTGSPVIYRADVSGIAISWVVENFGQSPITNPDFGDCVYVRNGTVNIDGLYFFQTTGSWINPLASSGSVILNGITTDNTTRWDGVQWVPDQIINNDGFGKVYAPDDMVADASKAQSLEFQAANKTAGTGDGGDIGLTAGSSTGGVTGDVRLVGNAVIFSPNLTPTYRLGGAFIGSNGKLRIGQDTVFRDVDGADINGEITGFEDLSDSSIAFTDGTLTFDLNLTGLDPIVIWIKGQRFEYTVAQSIVITNTVGNHYIYFDATGTLVSNTIFDLQAGLKNFVLVGIVHWNGTSGSLVADRRHLLTMDGDARFHQRNVKPIEVKSPDFALTVGNFTGSGAGSYQFAVASGTRYVEELTDVISSVSIAASQIPFLYLNATNEVIKGAATTIPVLNNGLNNVYNLFSLGAWSLQAVATDSFVNYWLVLTTDINHPIALVVGQSFHTSLDAALQEDHANLSTFLPSTEYTFLYRLTYASIGSLSVGARQYDKLWDLNSTYGRLADLTMIANTDRDLYHVEAENQDLYWSPGSGQITWTQQINVGVTGMAAIGSNYIAAGNVSLTDGEVAYVTIDRRLAPVAALTLTVDTITNFLTQNSGHENRVIIFKRIGSECFYFRGNAEKIQKRTDLIDNQIAAASIFNFPNSILPNYSYLVEYSIYRNGTIENGIIYVVRGAIGNIGQSIAGSSNGSTGVTLTVAESGSTLQLQYTSTSTGVAPVIRYSIKPWLTT